MRDGGSVMAECCNHKKKARSPEEKRRLVARLNRISGQVSGVKNMVEDDRYCADVLIQLAAIEKAVKSLASLVLEEHVHTCLVENIRTGNSDAAADEIAELFRRFQ